ncbi:Aste57867_6957 [Aphanomyces stellatus]|uniref:Aste57867_6957 protein n=1 Tax=Aphanomyces stellatus TaxID=120398 RepID=A0A485KHT0_9STRA|nr:hypothetical protein As57867_006935 [Aphanomyces stellatus]VFT83909.1 Aste57867_6957 [Aphanomyces stellatus]
MQPINNKMESLPLNRTWDLERKPQHRMAGTREGLRERWASQSRGVTFMSPQGLKERLTRRCMEHMKKNRKRILENLRHQSSDVPSEVMDMSESACLEDLMHSGDLSHDDYLDILTSLESALREEMRTEELQLAEELLEAEDAWIADFQELDLDQGHHATAFVLCPICKKHGVSMGTTHESWDVAPALECVCGFHLPLPRGARERDPLERFQDAMSNAFEAHRCMCDEDPSFHTSAGHDISLDTHLYLDCNCCGSFMQVI